MVRLISIHENIFVAVFQFEHSHILTLHLHTDTPTENKWKKDEKVHIQHI